MEFILVQGWLPYGGQGGRGEGSMGYGGVESQPVPVPGILLVSTSTPLPPMLDSIQYKYPLITVWNIHAEYQGGMVGCPRGGRWGHGGWV